MGKKKGPRDVGLTAELSFDFFLKILINGFEEKFRRQVLVGRHFFTVDTGRKIFGHLAFFYGLDTNGFKRLAEIDELFVAIKFSAVKETTSPGKDRCHRVRRRRQTFLVHAVVTSHCSVRSFSFKGLSIWSHEH